MNERLINEDEKSFLDELEQLLKISGDLSHEGWLKDPQVSDRWLFNVRELYAKYPACKIGLICALNYISKRSKV